FPHAPTVASTVTIATTRQRSTPEGDAARLRAGCEPAVRPSGRAAAQVAGVDQVVLAAVRELDPVADPREAGHPDHPPGRARRHAPQRVVGRLDLVLLMERLLGHATSVPQGRRFKGNRAPPTVVISHESLTRGEQMPDLKTTTLPLMPLA